MGNPSAHEIKQMITTKLNQSIKYMQTRLIFKIFHHSDSSFALSDGYMYL